MKRTNTGTSRWRQTVRCWETVFSWEVLITVDGVHRFDESVLSDITFSRSVGNKALRGIVTQCLTFKAYSATDLGITEGAAVRISLGSENFPTFYAASVERDGDVYSITAYDCCKNLDVQFDYSQYDQFDSSGKKTSDHVMWYTTGTVLGDLAHQCGFASSSPSISRRPRMRYLDFAEKTCRQILEDISVAECGHWECSTDNKLVFVAFDPDLSGNSFTVDEEDRSEIHVRGVKTISDTFSEDETYGKITKQTNTDWKNTEIISGRYMNAANAAAVAAQILGHGGSYVYTGWDAQIITEHIRPLNSSIYYGSGYLPCYEQSYRIAPVMVASFSAAKPDNSYTQYQSLYARQIAGKVTLGRSMGNFFLTETGSGLRMKL
jgi:hypothetical protein